MVALSASKEYDEFSVADLVELSGVSSRSFYDLFSDKEACFLATMEEILGNGRRLAVRAIADFDGSGEELASAAVDTFIALIVAQPAAAQLCMVTAFCAGEKPRARIDRAVSEFSSLLQGALESAKGREGMGPQLATAILGGIAVSLYEPLAARRYEEIRRLGPKLRAWALSVPPPPSRLLPVARSRRRSPAPAPLPPFAAQLPAERILRGFAAVLARKSYATASIADIAAEARISQKTFYNHFRDKRDAFSAALESSGAQMLAPTLPALRRAGEWPAAVRVASESLCRFLAAERDYAHLREVEVYAVGPVAVGQRNRERAEIVRVLGEVAAGAPTPDPVAVGATLGAFQALTYARLRQRRFAALSEVAPVVTYLALAPHLGTEQAHAVATR